MANTYSEFPNSDIVDANIRKALANYPTKSDFSSAMESKQDTLTTSQANAVDSGITSELVGKLKGIENGAQKNPDLSGYARKEDVKSYLVYKADLVDGKVPAHQLPSYVDDVLEYDSVSSFPAEGEGGKIYVAKDTNRAYRWGGTQYVEISQSLAIGETSTTAYPGDKGLALSRKVDAHVSNTNNPHAVTAEQVGALPATKKTNGQYEVSPNVSFLSGLKIESREAGVRLPVMFGVVDNETEGVTTFKITIPPVGGFKIDFSNGNAHTFLNPDGSDVLTKSVADALYPSKTEVGEKVKSFASVGGATATVENGVAKLSEFFTESNSLLNGRLAYSRNATGLKDRAFNTLSFDGTEFNLSTALEEVTPTASGQPRALLIVATATAATTIGYTAGTIKGDKPTIDGSGTWLITLTEYASGVWYCRQIKMEDAA